jgi:hypothetical protein
LKIIRKEGVDSAKLKSLTWIEVSANERIRIESSDPRSKPRTKYNGSGAGEVVSERCDWWSKE